MAHTAAELVLVELGNRAREQRVLGFAFALFFRKARHIEPDGAGSAKHKIHPVQRFVRGQQRIALTGERFGLFFVHRQN